MSAAFNVGIKIIDGEVFDKMSVVKRFVGYGQVVVFDNKATSDDEPVVTNGDESESGAPFLVRILQYLETPQYLRRRLFPMHNSLRFVVGIYFFFLKFLVRVCKSFDHLTNFYLLVFRYSFKGSASPTRCSSPCTKT